MLYYSNFWAFRQEDKKTFGAQRKSNALMDVQYQERTIVLAQIPSLSRLKLKNLDSVLSICLDMWNEVNCLLDRFGTWKWKEIEIVLAQWSGG